MFHGVPPICFAKADNYADIFSDIDFLLDLTRAIWLGECHYMRKRCYLDKVKSTANRRIGLCEKISTAGVILCKKS